MNELWKYEDKWKNSRTKVTYCVITCVWSVQNKQTDETEKWFVFAHDWRGNKWQAKVSVSTDKYVLELDGCNGWIILHTYNKTL